MSSLVFRVYEGNSLFKDIFFFSFGDNLFYATLFSICLMLKEIYHEFKELFHLKIVLPSLSCNRHPQASRLSDSIQSTLKLLTIFIQSGFWGKKYNNNAGSLKSRDPASHPIQDQIWRDSP